VVLQDPILFPAYIAWKQAVEMSILLGNAEGGGGAEAAQAMLPGICAVVQEWHLSGLPESLTPETFPATPMKAAQSLIEWLIEEIRKVIAGEEDIPNS
jgi:hypothetical protein